MIVSTRRAFLHQLGFATAGVAWLQSGQQSFGAVRPVRNPLPRSTPEHQGIQSEGILAFLDAIARSKHEFHSFMLARHGHVVAEGWWRPYRPEAPHMLYSLSKSFTSTGIGFAVAEKRLTVNDKVVSFFPEDLPAEISENLAALRVRDLLSMSVGHAQDSTPSLWDQENWVKQFLSLPIANPPGTNFLYNSGATYMLSAIVQKVTGQKLIDYLTPRLFEPLGIRGMTWEACPRGINTGGWGLKLPTEALAKFGQLYLQKGVWHGKVVLPASWIEEATTFKIQQPAPDLEQAKIRSDWHQGYCYQFWRCRHNAYRGDGAFGQYMIVLPEQDAVIAITSESSNMQGQLDLIWEHLLPAMKNSPCPAQKSEQQKLSGVLNSLTLPVVSGSRISPQADLISGRAIPVEPNALSVTSVRWIFAGDHCVFSLKDNSGEHAVRCGLGKWVDGESAMPETPPKLTRGKLPAISKLSASGAWGDGKTFKMIWRYYETPHHDIVTCSFNGDKFSIEFLDSISAMSAGKKDKRPLLRGSLS